MINKKKSEIEKCIIHKVGNKYNMGKNSLSENLVRFDEESYEVILPFLLKPFVSLTLSHRFNTTESKLFKICDNFFQQQDNFIQTSKEIAEHLYNQSNSAQIKTGDVLIVLFEGIEYQDILTEAIGVFKIETKSDFLQTYLEEDSFDVVTQKGISPKKLDKGCLILNTKDDKGNIVLTVDNNDYDTQYWVKKFMDVSYSDDKNYHTHVYLDMCNSFANDVILDNKKKGEFLSDVIDFFKCTELFQEEEFKNSVFEDENHTELFKTYKTTYETFNDVVVRNSFEVSDPVVKKEKRKLKTKIKLDTGIEINLDIDNPDSAKEYLEVGYDEEKKMKFYKLYFYAEK